MPNIQNQKRREFIKTTSGLAVAGAIAGCVGADTDEEGGEIAGDLPVITIPNHGVGEVLLTGRDPGFATKAYVENNGFWINVYDTVLDESPNQEKIGGIAEDWEFVDPLTLEFNIRDGVTFHSGNELDSEDVRYSIVRTLEMGGPAASQFEGYLTPDGVTAPDEDTVVCELEQPFRTITDLFVVMFVVDSELVKENADGDWGHDYLSQNDAGSGPYQTTQFELENQIRFEKFDDYWKGFPDNSIEEGRLMAITEDSTVIGMMDSNEGHLTRFDLSPETYEQMEAAEHTEIVDQTALANWFHHFNAERPPFDDRDVRKAFTLAVDWSSIPGIVGEGTVIAAGPVPRDVPGHNDDLEPHTQDLNEAMSAIDDSSYTVDEINDLDVTFHQYRDSGPVNQFPVMLQSQLQELGIETQIRETTWANLTDRIGNPSESRELWGGNFDAPGAPLSPDPFTYAAHHPNAIGSNFYAANYFTDPELTDVLEEARAQETQESAFALYEEAQEILYDEYAMLWIANPGRRRGKRVELQGYEPRGTPGFQTRFQEWTWQG